MIDSLGLTRYLDADGLRDVIVGLTARGRGPQARNRPSA